MSSGVNYLYFFRMNDQKFWKLYEPTCSPGSELSSSLAVRSSTIKNVLHIYRSNLSNQCVNFWYIFYPYSFVCNFGWGLAIDGLFAIYSCMAAWSVHCKHIWITLFDRVPSLYKSASKAQNPPIVLHMYRSYLLKTIRNFEKMSFLLYKRKELPNHKSFTYRLTSYETIDLFPSHSTLSAVMLISLHGYVNQWCNLERLLSIPHSLHTNIAWILGLWRQFGYQRKQRFKVQRNGKDRHERPYKSLFLIPIKSVYTYAPIIFFVLDLSFLKYRTIQRICCYQNTLFYLKLFFQYIFEILDLRHIFCRSSDIY